MNTLIDMKELINRKKKNEEDGAGKAILSYLILPCSAVKREQPSEHKTGTLELIGKLPSADHKPSKTDGKLLK